VGAPPFFHSFVLLFLVDLLRGCHGPVDDVLFRRGVFYFVVDMIPHCHERFLSHFPFAFGVEGLEDHFKALQRNLLLVKALVFPYRLDKFFHVDRPSVVFIDHLEDHPGRRKGFDLEQKEKQHQEQPQEGCSSAVVDLRLQVFA
jgi:hypothetical protein